MIPIICWRTRNDPNYLPPPEDIDLSSNSNSNSNNNNTDSYSDNKSDNITPKKHKRNKILSLKSLDDSTDTIPPSPGQSELNPWAHLNKTTTNNIMEAPIEEASDNGSFEDRGFLKHEADDHSDIDTPYANGININNNKNNTKNTQMTKCCYCLIFIIGIVIGVLLTVALIRHQAIDANYLFGPIEKESENDTVIKQEFNALYNNSNTQQPTKSMFNVWNGFRNKTWKHKTRMPTNTPTDKPSNNPTINPTYTPTLIPTNSPIITDKPSGNPSHNPSHNPTNNPSVYSKEIISNSPTKSPSVYRKEKISNSPTNNPSMVSKEIISDSPTHSPVISESDTKSEIQSKLETDVKTDSDVKLENDTIKQEYITINNGLIPLSDLNEGNEKTTPTPTDYHHVHQGIEIANKELSENEIDSNKESDGLLQMSDTNKNNTKKSTPTPTDYHSVHQGIEIANKALIEKEIDSNKESDGNKEDESNGLLQMSDINENNTNKTTPTPTDYHSVHQGIEIANNESNNESNDNQSNSHNSIDLSVINHTKNNTDQNKGQETNESNPQNNTNNNNTNLHKDEGSKDYNFDVNKDLNKEKENENANEKKKEYTETDTENKNESQNKNTLSKSTPIPTANPTQHSNDNTMKDSTISDDKLPLCNVIPNTQCNSNTNTNRLPLPFDKPLSAQLKCHENTCQSPLNLPGQRIISGETYEADKTVMDIQSEIAITCHTKELNKIKVEREGYNNNENWQYCIRISNDNSLETFPILHMTFSLISFDIEQGFDNLFMTTQFGEIFDDYSESWTGNWSTLHTFEPNTWYQNYWMTSAKPNTFIELCLRFISDESITSHGFVSKFSITREIGYLSEWSLCTAHSNTQTIANGACGIGVHRRESYCPQYIIENMNPNERERFDWSNGTHSCIHKYSNYPLNKYCIVANCQDIDNDKYAPVNVIKNLGGKWGENSQYIYNGRTRIDPQYANPFNIIMNTNRYKINLDELKTNLQYEIDNILQRYPVISQELFPKTFEILERHFDALGIRLLSSLLLGRVFTYVSTGSSNTAGHDNVFMSGYPMQLNSLMQIIWKKYSIYGGAFRVRNQAIGGHLGTMKQGPCINAIIGTYDLNIDMVSWESFMNDGTHVDPIYEEIWLRNILLTYNKTHSLPFLTCISTSETPQAGCRIDGGRYVFNSFLGYYSNATGVTNYYGQYVCNEKLLCNKTQLFDENGNEIACVNRKGNEACTAGHVSWHPSPHRHRVMAETFAVALLQSIINTINKLYQNINQILQKNNGYPSYELACLLEGKYNMNSFQRPITKPIKCSGAGEDNFEGILCRNAMWCATSFWPAPKHNQLHRYFININGFYNNDTIDLPVSPLIMRNGGRAPIDHKAQWISKNKIGNFLEIKVKVPNRYIMIVYPQGTSRTNIGELFSSFQFLVNGIKKKCQSISYDKNIKRFCLLDCFKPGKYILKITIIDDINEFITPNPKSYAIDEIAGI